MSQQIGVLFPTHDMPADPGAMRQWAQAVEEIGFDYVQVPDRVLGADREKIPDYVGRYDIDDWFHETFVTLAFLAAIMDRVALSTGVLVLPPRQTALVAKQAAQVDILCGGRFRLGIGVGTNRLEYEALGQEWRVRGRRQAEQIELMNRLWTERSVYFEGKYDTVRHAGISPLPVQRPIPIWFGGDADPILRRAAKFGRGWIPLDRPNDELKARLEKLRGFVREEGRDPAEFGLEPWIRSSIGGPSEWRAEIDRWIALGATHLTFYTSRLGVGPVDRQIEAMREFYAVASG